MIADRVSDKNPKAAGQVEIRDDRAEDVVSYRKGFGSASRSDQDDDEHADCVGDDYEQAA